MRKRTWILVFILCASMTWAPVQRAFAATNLEMNNSDNTGETNVDREESNSGSSEKSKYESQLDDLNAQIEKIKNQQADVKRQLASTTDELNKKMAERSAQEEQLQLTGQEITLKEQRVNVFNNLIEEKLDEIDQKQEEIKDKQSDIDYNFEQYKKRLRANYMAGESSKLAMMIGASDFTDFLMRGEIVQATAQHDQDLVDQLKTDRKDLELQQQELEVSKQELEEQKTAVEKEKLELEERKKEHQAVFDALSSVVQDIAEEREYYLKHKAEIDRQMVQAQKDVERILEALKPKMSETYVGGEWAWPLPGHTQITSAYQAGDRSDNHTGTDIAGGSCYGASIVAANDGKVIFTAATNTGYGHYVIVDHGGGCSSLYAHMSSISVSVGQTVSRGTTEIGKVGSTGWATGPHLHFEVRQNNKPVNPRAYIG